MASLMEESLSKLSKKELIPMMLKMQKKKKKGIFRYDERYLNLIKVFSNLNLTLLQLKMLIASWAMLGKCPVFSE